MCSTLRFRGYTKDILTPAVEKPVVLLGKILKSTASSTLSGMSPHACKYVSPAMPHISTFSFRFPSAFQLLPPPRGEKLKEIVSGGAGGAREGQLFSLPFRRISGRNKRGRWKEGRKRENKHPFLSPHSVFSAPRSLNGEAGQE